MNESPDDPRADEAGRNYLAQTWWPQPPAQPPVQPQQHEAPSDSAPLRQSDGLQPPHAAASRSWLGSETRPPQPMAGQYQGAPDPTQHWPVVYSGTSPWNAPPPSTKKRPSAWRSIGIGAVGLIAGLFGCLILQDVLGMVFVLNGETFPLGIAAVIGSFMPILAVTGVVIALLIDRAARARRPGSDAANRH